MNNGPNIGSHIAKILAKREGMFTIEEIQVTIKQKQKQSKAFQTVGDRHFNACFIEYLS